MKTSTQAGSPRGFQAKQGSTTKDLGEFSEILLTMEGVGTEVFFFFFFYRAIGFFFFFFFTLYKANVH